MSGRRIPIITLVTLLLTITGAAYSQPADPHTISIAEARSLPLGTVVTIDGSVTFQSGGFSSSTGDQGFAIQDRTGGIYVSVPDNHGFGLRQQVRVTGELGNLEFVPGLLVLINVTDVKAHGTGPKVHALPVATGGVGEGTEGKLVTITATITQFEDDSPFGFQYTVNDGSGDVHVFVAISTGIDVSGLSVGQTIEVTGFSGQFDTSYEVDPRIQDDIKVLP